MSISLLISGQNMPEAQWKNIPLASEEAFKEFWMPLVGDLEFIPLFEFGLTVDKDNLDDVMKELHSLELKMSKLSEQNVSYKKPLERIRQLKEILPKIDLDYSQIFIG